ncbi:hypothetical protein C4D60_Mb01t18010 [Musa balbisiana]|uniref:Uncharacterized protein n=1 Tax=Musa balbisiana TaxID=52838 RepID=A0A4V4H7F8_MUSBA|nr:hypothetical protein C4D60_Mb01t18010 [Musa balbisiana]
MSPAPLLLFLSSYLFIPFNSRSGPDYSPSSPQYSPSAGYSPTSPGYSPSSTSQYTPQMSNEDEESTR